MIGGGACIWHAILLHLLIWKEEIRVKHVVDLHQCRKVKTHCDWAYLL